MITLVTGGSGSGKSEYAEGQLLAAGAYRRYYIATMRAFGPEDERKISRHRRLRRGKGFATVECPRDVARLCREGDGEKAALLECVMNLAANELFETPWSHGADEARRAAAGRILQGVRSLAGQVRELVVVTGEVGSDGVCYEPETMQYIRLVGEVNRALAAMADQVTEVVCGIPVTIKPWKEGGAG